jgi:chromosome partitioning protein
VLVVDLDPQRNLTSGLGFTLPEGAPTAYDLLVGRRPAVELAQPTSIPNLSLIPGSADLAGIDVELATGDESGERQLAVGLRTAGDAEVILVDTPPSLGLVTVSALAIADGVLVPVQCEYYALEGLSQLMATIRLVRERLNPALQVNGLLLTMLDPRTKLGSDVVREVESHFGDLVACRVRYAWPKRQATGLRSEVMRQAPRVLNRTHRLQRNSMPGCSTEPL